MISKQVPCTMRAMTTRIAAIALALVCATFAAGCDGDEQEAPPSVTDTAPPTVSETSPPDDTSSAAVYFLRDGKVAPVRRAVPTSLDPERAALEALLEGPTADEAASGLTSAIPDGTELRDVSLDGGVATVDLEGTFDQGGGSASMLGRVAQVVATLTRFGTVEKVAFRLDGEPVDAIGGEGVSVDPPIGRRAIEDQTPQILIESPLPGDSVTSPIRLRGTANVFEANVSIEVRDETGTVLLQAFTTATSGTGTRGTFDTTLSLPTVTGNLTVIAFEASAEDGRPIHANDVQVTLTR